jgi:hypothetical protein
MIAGKSLARSEPPIRPIGVHPVSLKGLSLSEQVATTLIWPWEKIWQRMKQLLSNVRNGLGSAWQGCQNA